MQQEIQQNSSDAQTSTETETEMMMTRRGAMRAGAGAVVAVSMLGSVGVVSAAGERPDFESDFVQNPWVNGSVTVELHESGMSELEHYSDDGDIESLSDEYGIVLARRVDEDTPHNPVSLSASDIDSSEYRAFPRGATYDDDSDVDTDEVDVSALDSEHWTVDNSGSTGTLSLSDEGDALVIDVPSQAGGDVATATFDLSSVGSEDMTISSGIDRKFLQLVADIDVLESATVVEFQVTDSEGTSKVATIDSAVDTATEAGLANATGPSQVLEARLGELTNSLVDIEKLVIAVTEGAFSATLHGLNLERESEWTFGVREVLESNAMDADADDGDSEDEVITEEVKRPSGSFSITSLSTLDSTPFAGADIANVSYDVEMLAGELPSSMVMSRVVDTSSAYDRPKELEHVVAFEWPSAYDITSSLENLADEVKLPSSRFLSIETATGVTTFEDWDWDDVEDASWSSKSSVYGSVGDDVEVLSTVSASDATVVRFRTLLEDNEVSAATKSSSGAAVVASGGSGGFNSMKTIVFGAILGIVAWFRNDILGALRG